MIIYTKFQKKVIFHLILSTIIVLIIIRCFSPLFSTEIHSKFNLTINLHERVKYLFFELISQGKIPSIHTIKDKKSSMLANNHIDFLINEATFNDAQFISSFCDLMKLLIIF
jgi:hypothetical protein